MHRSLLGYGDLSGSVHTLHAAIALHNQGALGEAERRYRFVLAVDPGHYEALYRLGLIYLQQARFGNAADLFRRALKIERQSADAHHHLAVALSGLNRHQEAVRLYETALAAKPAYPEAHNNLGRSLQALGHNEEAIIHYEKALAIRPDYAEARNNFGTALQTLERLVEAAAHYQAALALRPHYVEALKNLGHVLGVLGRHREAVLYFERALALCPADTGIGVMLGDALLRLDRPEDAIACFHKALALDAADIDARNGLGCALHMLGRSEEALEQHRMVLSVRPTDVVAHSKLGDALLALGRVAEASAALEQAAALSPRRAGFFWNLANAKRFAENDPNLAEMEMLAGQLSSLNAEEQIDLRFALGKALSDIGEHARSFAHLREGNALMRRRVTYNEAEALGRFERMRAVFSRSLMREKRGLGDPSSTPVFIIGMPRSGTTLIEQILASHPQVFGAGEVRDMAELAEQVVAADGAVLPEAVAAMSGEELRRLGDDYLRRIKRLAPQAGRITDKMPGNFVLAGLIHLVLPNARIIHACRDLRDTAFSCFSLLFARGHGYSYDLAELGRYCRGYHQLVAHWHEVMPGIILDVQYENLVGDLETQARRVVAHCGLPWDDGCLHFHQTQRSVRTASAAQVRQPIYQSSIGRWRPHEQALQPLLRELTP